MDLPSPTKKQAPFMITSLALSMAYQICEAFLIGSLLSQLFLTLYLLLRAVMQRLSFPTATIQANLAIKALLKSLVCRNPRLLRNLTQVVP